jgi:hypothetical protein
MKSLAAGCIVDPDIKPASVTIKGKFRTAAHRYPLILMYLPFTAPKGSLMGQVSVLSINASW